MSGSLYTTVEDAARRLATTPLALRARCRRHARRVGRDVVAHLGGGITAIKLGRSWRISFSTVGTNDGRPLAGIEKEK